MINHRHIDLVQRERKFILDAGAAREVWSEVCEQFRSDSIASGPPMYVRTTYFDTPDLAYFRSTRGAIARRLRVREYASAPRNGGAPVLSPHCYLELKQSANGLRRKTRRRLRPNDLTAQLSKLPDAPVSACVGSLYRRAARTSLDGRLRITLDDCVVFCRPSAAGSPFELDGSTAIAAGPQFVLEVKQCNGSPHWLAAVLDGLEDATGFSKFTTGMTAAAERGLVAALPVRAAGAGG